ncbi:MAG: hypothetical protein D6766_09145 [Verrucomicrobia bacterium]|nr:MAG: hypothetical protein D6766_09145 [Verrucomicrobiota bacterium]
MPRWLESTGRPSPDGLACQRCRRSAGLARPAMRRQPCRWIRLPSWGLGGSMPRSSGRLAGGVPPPTARAHGQEPFSRSNMTSKNIVAFGEILWDLLPDGPVLGGAPFNFTCRMHQFGHRARIISRLGRDDLGLKAFERIEVMGMDGSLIQWHDRKPTGTVPIRLSEDGVPDFEIVPDVAYDEIEPTPEAREAAAGADCFCFGTLVQRAPVSRATLAGLLEAATSGLKVLDINLRRNCYTPETVRFSLEKADWLKLNEDETAFVAEVGGLAARPLRDFARAVLERWKLQGCVITLGEKGVLAANARGELHYEPGRKVPVKDTCGSGDALTAAFVDALLAGLPLWECCRLGNAMGALVAMQAGATEPLARTSVEALLRAPGEAIVHEELQDLVLL